MKVKSISYPTSLDKIIDIENDNIDIFVELENGLNLTFVVITPQNLLWYMNKENTEFFEASPPNIIVKSLTEDNIRMAIESYAEDNAYWLKLYYVAGLGKELVPTELLDMLIQKSIKEMEL